MATGTQVPWHDGGGNRLSRSFAACDVRLASLIASRQVNLTQFRAKGVNAEVAALKWRHYFVHWTAATACQISAEREKNFVELGVCDGLTAWYAADARRQSGCDGQFYLYDAWAGMRSDLLTSSEKTSEESHAFLNVENTKRNLALSGANDFVFNKGYLPESFSTCPNPVSVAWLHIDLNSALPTIASLDYFWEKMLPGGIILFDDFSWPGYEDTRQQIEAWCEKRNIDVLQLPTGQALISKKAIS